VDSASKKKERTMKTIERTRSERGSTMFVALLFIALAMGLMLAVTQATFDNRESTTDYAEREEGLFAAQGTLEYTLAELWSKWKFGNTNHRDAGCHVSLDHRAGRFRFDRG
jgi:hypothetical protein